MKYTVKEIFSSIQGEGLMAGKPMNFIRFTRCNLACRWCDTDFTGGREMTAKDVTQNLSRKLTWVSLTGGEPMMEEGLDKLIDELHSGGFKVLLETNGTMFDQKIFGSCDFISADIKPPSSGNQTWDPKVLEYCFEHPEKSQVKVVIQDNGDIEFFGKIFREDYSYWVLQPEEKSRGKLDYSRIVAEFGDQIRIIPQIHKSLKVR